MSDYAAWRISYQTSEQAAKAAYEQTQEQKARIAQLEAQLAVAQQGAQDAEPAAWVATFKPEGLLALHSVVGANLEELKQSVSSNSVFRPLYTYPSTQGLEAQVQDRLDRLYLALEVCSAELFAQCADQGRAMKYVDQARSALAAEQCARAAIPPAAQELSADALDAKRYRWLRRKVCIVGGKFHILNLDPRYIAPDAAIELDSAIDAAIAAQAKQGGAA